MKRGSVVITCFSFMAFRCCDAVIAQPGSPSFCITLVEGPHGERPLPTAMRVERFPLSTIQMDCGLPWTDLQDHEVMLPRRWWVHVNSPPALARLSPGTYRILLMGADMNTMHTNGFQLP